MAQACFKSWFVDFEPTRTKMAALAAGGSEEDLNLAAMSAISGKSAQALATLKATNPESYANLHSTASLFPSRLEMSELGEIPEGWGYKSAETLYDIAIGKTPPRKESQWFSRNPADIKWLSIKDMGNNSVFTGDTSEYLTSKAVAKHNVKIVPAKTVLLSFKLTVGRVQIASDEICTNEAIAHLKQKEKSPDHIWTYCYLKQFDYSKLGSTSSIATAVNSQTIKKMPVLCAGEELLRRFMVAMENVFSEIVGNEKQSQTLTQLRDSLLPKLLSGEISVDATTQASEAV
ncbi:hypothetical protein CAPTEDRAFT_121954 [Capitella teleta]|uniref:Type I restriction modification DNA specificity domain-containing protein n=1 Tax=Capitella teleta TaxID=283909 RepID=R7TL87_CAPTE|nr:hypothetical protein CAPTEDRAFT_121954 [Capitella teleta]|eukprot:ELT94434.1 hypothetical protein CAPTEDRAFT_121954 [Capitella teleta]